MVSPLTTSSPLPSLSAFLVVARHGAAVQVRLAGARLRVVEARTPLAEGEQVVPFLPVFEATLADHFGGDVAALALAGLRPRPGEATAMPAERVLLVWGVAESQCTLNDARSFMQQMELSARLLGRRFCRLCEEMELDPKALPAERREALDQAVGWRPGLRVAEAETRLRELLGGAQLH